MASASAPVATERYLNLKGTTTYGQCTCIPFLDDLIWVLPPNNSDRMRFEELCALKQAKPGVFRASNGALYHEYNDLFGKCLYTDAREIDRTDPALVQTVEELGDKANGRHAKLKIAEVPSGTLYRIDEYDGNESVMTQDDYDWKIA